MGGKPAQIAIIGLAVGIFYGAATATARAQSEAPPMCAAREMVPPQLRPLDCRLATAIADGLKRSTTFQQLVERVGTLGGIVYIQLKPYVNLHTKRVLDGALSHSVTTAGTHRVLHLAVGVAHGDRPIVVLAHELQHAIEVLEAPDVSTEHAVDQLFERIGMPAHTGVVETQAALDAERAVRSELSQRHRNSTSPSRTRSPGLSKAFLLGVDENIAIGPYSIPLSSLARDSKGRRLNLRCAGGHWFCKGG